MADCCIVARIGYGRVTPLRARVLQDVGRGGAYRGVRISCKEQHLQHAIIIKAAEDRYSQDDGRETNNLQAYVPIKQHEKGAEGNVYKRV